MGKTLTELTAEQQAQIETTRDYWLSVGLSTAPADRARAQSGVCAAYAEAGLAPPRIWIWLESPLAGSLGAAMLQHHLRPAQVLAQVRDRVRDLVGDKVGDLVWQVLAQVRDQVGAQVGAQLGDRVRDQVGDQVGDRVRDQVGAAGYGSHDSPWLSFYAFLGQTCGLTCCDRLRGLMEISESCGWWWPFENACILTDRPCVIHRDADHRLHHASEMAIRYRDGWGIYAWHGVRMPERYFTQDVSAKDILLEPNAEVRRALIERYDEQYGKGKFIEDVGARVIDSSVQSMRAGEPDQINELLAIDLPDDPDGRMVALRVIDPSTGRRYIIRVPPDQKTVRGALAWTFGMSEHEYVLQQES